MSYFRTSRRAGFRSNTVRANGYRTTNFLPAPRAHATAASTRRFPTPWPARALDTPVCSITAIWRDERYVSSARRPEAPPGRKKTPSPSCSSC